MIVGIVEGHLARRSSRGVELLDLPYVDLGEALRAGLDAAAIASAGVLRHLDLAGVVPQAPVGSSTALWAVGLAYADHVSEAGEVLPERGEPNFPALFVKASSSIAGPEDDIRLPAIAPTAVDYEGEVAVVIGTAGRAIVASDGWSHVFGVTAANDVSARDVQHGRFLGGVADPSKAKSFDTFTPIGPWVVTPDEFADRDAIGLRTEVNGEVRQAARTSQLLYPIPSIVSAVSQFVTLHPGDVILTGTPGGVGMARGRYLAAGDEVSVTVEVVGELRNYVTGPAGTPGATQSKGESIP